MNKFIDWLDKHEAEFTGFCVGLNLMAVFMPLKGVSGHGCCLVLPS